MAIPLRSGAPESVPSSARSLVLVAADDHDIVARIRAGDEAAFETLFNTYYDALVAFVAGYTQSVAIAEELLQDLFLALWRTRETWELRDGSLKTYLYQAARNRALNRLQRARTEERWTDDTAYDPEPFTGGTRTEPADESLEARDLAVAARSAIDRLPTRCRQTFLLNRQAHLTYAEVARVMGTSEHTVKIQMARALAALRTRLAPWLR